VSVVLRFWKILKTTKSLTLSGNPERTLSRTVVFTQECAPREYELHQLYLYQIARLESRDIWIMRQ